MLDPDSHLPLYHQLERQIRQHIESGVWAAHEAIPPERELIEQYGVSRITVRQALSNLVAAGLLYRRHGKGTFVADTRQGPIAAPLYELTGHLEELQLRGLNPAVTVLTLETGPMPESVARVLERPVGSTGWHLYRLVSVEGLPLMLTTVYLPTDLGITLTEPMLLQHGLTAVLREHGYVGKRGIQRIGAVSAEPEEAKLLGLNPGDALLRVTRVAVDPQDRPLVWFKTLYRADRYEFEIELIRRRT